MYFEPLGHQECCVQYRKQEINQVSLRCVDSVCNELKYSHSSKFCVELRDSTNVLRKALVVCLLLIITDIHNLLSRFYTYFISTNILEKNKTGTLGY